MPSLSKDATSNLNAILSELTSSKDGAQPSLAGCMIGVVDSQSTLFSSGAGRRNINEVDDSRGPVTPDTHLYIASCTKLITSLCMLHLIDVEAQKEGSKDGITSSTFPQGPDTLIEKWAPELARDKLKLLSGWDEEKDEPIFEEVKNDITIAMLLNHTAGFTYTFMTPLYKRYSERMGWPEALAFSKASSFRNILIAQPGAGFNYGQNSDWAGELVSRISGKSLGDYMKELFFDPLGMKSTAFYAHKITDEKSVIDSKRGMKIHFRTPGGLVVPPEPLLPTEPDYEIGGAGLISTVSDYTKFLSYLLRLAQPDKRGDHPGTYLGKPVADLVFKPSAPEGVIEPGIGAMTSFEKAVSPKGGNYDTGLTHTLAAALFKEGSDTGISPGSIFWGGITHLLWSVDHTKDVAIMSATQILPLGDQTFRGFNDKVVEAVYQGLQA